MPVITGARVQCACIMGPRRALLSLKGSKVETLDSTKSGSACF